MYRYKNIVLQTDDLVYEPREDTIMLAEYVSDISKLNVLEMGCGPGLISLVLGKNNIVTAADINQRAVELAKRNSELNKIKISVVESDLFENIEGRFDLIVFNAPYLPDKDDITGAEQWSDNGVIERFIENARWHLNAKGRIIILISSLTDEERVKELFKQAGFEADAKKRLKIPWEELIILETKPL